MPSKKKKKKKVNGGIVARESARAKREAEQAAAAAAEAESPTESCRWAHPSRWKERRGKRAGGRLSAAIVDRFVISAGRRNE